MKGAALPRRRVTLRERLNDAAVALLTARGIAGAGTACDCTRAPKGTDAARAYRAVLSTITELLGPPSPEDLEEPAAAWLVRRAAEGSRTA